MKRSHSLLSTTTSTQGSVTLTVEEMRVVEEKAEKEHHKWRKHYSPNQRLLFVGEGDFSFSSSLALSFPSASNILATSLDTYDVLVKKYKKAKSNLEILLKLGASILHGVDATKMKLHSDLKMQKFDRIIYNFPHAGFHGKEDNIRMIERHKKLVLGFFKNASGMLRAYGEIHVTHKTSSPFCFWNIEELAWKNFLALVGRVNFRIEDHPGYNNKRGDGNRCDKPFPLGKCSTFKFSFSPATKKVSKIKSQVDFPRNTYELSNSFPTEIQYPPTSSHHGHPQMRFSTNVYDRVGQKLFSVAFSPRNSSPFGMHFNHASEIYHRPTLNGGNYFGNGAQQCNYGRYTAEASRRSQQSLPNPVEIQYQPHPFGSMDSQRGLEMNINGLSVRRESINDSDRWINYVSREAGRESVLLCGRPSEGRRMSYYERSIESAPGRGLEMNINGLSVRRESINDSDRRINYVSGEAGRESVLLSSRPSEGRRMSDYERSIESASGRTMYELNLLQDKNMRAVKQQKLVYNYH